MEKAKQLEEIFDLSSAAAMVALRRADWDVGNASIFLTDEGQKAAILAEAEQTLTPSLSSTVDPQEIAQLPACVLAHRREYFTLLFDMLLSANERVAHRVWDFLLTLPTSRNLLSRLETLDASQWESLLDAQSHYKLLYCLQIIDGFLFPRVEGEVDDSQTARVTWAVNFQATGGTIHLLGILSHAEWFAAANPSADIPQERKNCMSLTLKIVDFFLAILVDADALDVFGGKVRAALPTVTLDSFPKEIDWRGLLHKAVGIVGTTVQSPAPDGSDEGVVAFAMRLLTRCVLWDPSTLLEEFFGISHLSEWLLAAMLQSSPGVRAQATGTLQALCDKVSVDDPSLSPRNFFLRFLLKHLPSEEAPESQWSQCGEWCRFLDHLLSSVDTLDEFHSVALEFAQRIQNREIRESRNNQQVDELLAGMMIVLTSLVHREPKWRVEIGQEMGLVRSLYHDGLFARKAGAELLAPPKCKTRTSRLAAFGLLIELARDCPPNFLELLTLLTPHHNSTRFSYVDDSHHSAKIKSWDYHPSSDDKAACGYVGLRNLGNTCYINSLLQHFYMLPYLRYEMLGLPTEPEEESLVREMQHIFAYLQESEKVANEPRGFCHAYKDWDGKPTNVHIQQDVDEFFNLLCQRLETQMKSKGKEKLLSSIFGGKISNEIRSVDPDFPYVSETTEDFFTISLGIKGKSNIGEALNAYVTADRLEGDNAYFCEAHNRKVDATKRCSIKELSNSLILHLKRFEFDFSSFKKVKLNDYCEFPLFLDIKPWTKEGLASLEGLPIDPADKHPDEYYQYELKGVLVHSGGADAGHYYSYIKERSPSGGGQWFEFNDKEVSPFDPNDLPTECFGGTQEVNHWDNWTRQYVRRTYDRVRNAYMLFYDRVTPFQSPQAESNKTSELVRGIPSDIYRRVWEENAEFLRDRQMFDPTYFDFMLRFTQLVNFEPQLDYSVEPVEEDFGFQTIQLATHFVVGTLAHAKEAENFKLWISQLKLLLKDHIPACKWLLDYILSVPNLLKELLLECSSEKVRIGIVGLLNFVLRTLAPYEYDFFGDVEMVQVETKKGKEERSRSRSVVVRFMDEVLNLLEDSRSHWRRFKQYFLLIRDFALQGWREREMLFSRELISLYTDYFSGRPKKGQTRRESVMDRFNLPDLTEFISTLSVLVRSCATGARPEKGPPPTTIDDGRILQMPPKEAREIFDKHFFTSMLEMDYNTEAAVEIMVHISWEDLKQTKLCTEALMSEVARGSSSEKLPIFETLLESYLRLEDSLQPTRIIMTLSPFPAPGDPTKGLLALIHDFHSRSANFSYQLINLLLRLSKIPPVASYIAKQKRELIWIEQFLESRSGSTRMIAGTNSDEDDFDDEPKTLEPAHLLASIKELSLACGIEDEPNHDRERELMEEIQELRDMTFQLKEALEYYRSRAPQVKIPPFMLTKQWEEEKKTFFPNRYDDEEEDTEEDEPPSPRENNLEVEMEEMSTTELQEKANQLTDIFPNVPLRVAIIALRRSGFDVETAAGHLADENYVDEITKEADNDDLSPSKKLKKEATSDSELSPKEDRFTSGKRTLSQ